LALVDQIVFSAGSLLVVLFAARVATLGEFATFSAIYGIIAVWNGLNRSLFAEHALLASASDPALGRRMHGLAFAAACGFAAAGSGLVILIGELFLASSTHLNVAMGMALIAVVLQDVVRGFLISRQLFGHLVLLDLLWVLALAGGVAVLMWFGSVTPVQIGFAWAAALYLSFSIGVAFTALCPVIDGMFGWLRTVRGPGGALSLEFLTGFGMPQLVILVAAALGVSEVAAGLRILQVTFAGVSVGVQGLRGLVLARGFGTRLLSLRGVQVAVVTATSVNAAVFLIEPWELGETLFGASWSLASPAVLWLAFAEKALAATASVRSWELRLQSKFRQAATARIVGGLASLSLGLTPVLFGGGLSLVMFGLVLGAVITQTMYGRAIRKGVS
tara:strand:- start:800 stop:1966 length:1167 start_codon:yes stop_codon:yes gene_type:complete